MDFVIFQFNRSPLGKGGGGIGGLSSRLPTSNISSKMTKFALPSSLYFHQKVNHQRTYTLCELKYTHKLRSMDSDHKGPSQSLNFYTMCAPACFLICPYHTFTSSPPPPPPPPSPSPLRGLVNNNQGECLSNCHGTTNNKRIPRSFPVVIFGSTPRPALHLHREKKD